MTEPSTPKTRPDIEILHLDEPGYGPNGSMKRQDWRKECLVYLGESKVNFDAWQEQIKANHTNGSIAWFDLNIDGIKQTSFTQDACTLDFAGHVFDEGVAATGFEFMLPCNFRSATFTAGSANFQGATFTRGADFESVTFSVPTFFMFATFAGYANFRNAKFIQHANFHSATFSTDSDFRWAIFSKYTDFSKVTFTGEAYFAVKEFAQNVDFSSANFEKNVTFEGVPFNAVSDFHDAKFCKNSNFENANFVKVGHFEGAEFKTAPPSFRGVDIATTRLEFSNDYYFPRDSNTQQAVDDISFLKRLSDEHGQVDQALNFNAMELRAKRLLPDANWGFQAVTWLYEKLSDCGRSFTKPIIWYVVLICFGALLAMGYSTYSERPTEELQVLCKPIKDQPPPLKLSYERAVFEYAMFRAAGVMDFTDTGKQNNSVNCKLFDEPIEPPLMRAWGVFKGIASIALLFLAALGLRNKYRIK